MQEKKRGRGRPATGRKRDKQVSLQCTTEERDIIKNTAKKRNQTITDMVLDLIANK